MRAFAVSVFFLMLTFSDLQAQSKAESASSNYSPNFLIRNQLSPELLKIEVGAGVKNGSFENLNGTSIEQLTKNTYSISGYPLTLFAKEFTQLYVGFGYSHEKLTGFSQQSAYDIIIDSRYAANLNMFLNTKIKSRLFLSNYIQVGLNNDDLLNNSDNSLNWVAFTKLNFKKNDNTNFAVGAVYVSNFGSPFILPVLGYAHSTNRYVLNIDFPIKAEIETLLRHGKWRPVVGVAFPSATYYSNKTNKYFESTDLQWQAGIRYQVLKFIYAYAGFRGSFSETYSLGDRKNLNEIGSLDGYHQIIFSLSAQIAKI